MKPASLTTNFMYPILRFITSITKARFSKPVKFSSVTETTFLCMPWDLDIFLEMNNGRVLTLYDLGRFNLSVRTGFANVLKKNRWGLVVAGSTIRYRKRIKMFDKITMRTKVAGMDEKWIYVIQSMWVKGQPCSSVLLRTAVTAKGKIMPTENVLTAMNITQWQPEQSSWLKSWIESEEVRPWPPSP